MSVNSKGVVTIVVTTEIDAPHDQKGVKSQHYIDVDVAKGTVLDTGHFTGTTKFPMADIPLAELSSANDLFNAGIVSHKHGQTRVRIEGNTGTKIFEFVQKLVPGADVADINYAFELLVGLDGQFALLAGSHDGFPSYTLEIAGMTDPVYKFSHPELSSLLDLPKIYSLLEGTGDDVFIVPRKGVYDEKLKADAEKKSEKKKSKPKPQRAFTGGERAPTDNIGRRNEEWANEAASAGLLGGGPQYFVIVRDIGGAFAD